MINKNTLVLSLAILFIAPTALASDAALKTEVQGAFQTWQKSLSGKDAQKVVALYDQDAVLLATLHNDPITTQEQRTQYFEGLVKKPDMAVTIQQEDVRVLDENTAIISGVYTFSFKDAEKTAHIPARYSFVYEKNSAGQWLIENHHSSMLPKPAEENKQ
jgi:uncharacterized protein (TIGR02246 family)